MKYNTAFDSSLAICAVRACVKVLRKTGKEWSSRQVSPAAPGRCLFSPFAVWFPDGVTISRPYSSCLPAPLQNRACAIYAHGSSDGHSLPLYGAVPFPSFPASVCGRCFLAPLVHLSTPSLRQHYPLSSVLWVDPTPCHLFALPPFVRLSGHTPVSGRSRRVSRVTCQSLCRTCHGLRPRRRVCILALAVAALLTSVL